MGASMRWPWHAERPDARPIDADADIAAEVAAFLSGTSANRLAAGGDPVPAWAWLNRVAHRSPEDLVEMAEGVPPAGGEPDGATAAALIAAAVVRRAGGGPTAIRAVQSRRLVPLELDLMAGRVQAGSPAALIHAALVTVHTGRCQGLP